VVQGVGALSVNAANGSLNVVSGSPFAADLIPIDVLVHPSGKFVYTANIGTASIGIGPGPVQSISCYSSDPSTGALAPVPGSPFPVTSPTSNFDFMGLMIHPSGKFLYLGTGFLSPGSGGNGVLGWSIDPASGSLTPLAGSPFARGTTIPGGAFDPTGKFLYSGNAGNTLLGFNVDQSSGALTPLSGLPVLSGSILDAPVVDPAGAFLFAEDPKSKTLVGFRLDAQTGALTPLANPTPINGILVGLVMATAP
jgi:6-phosphogluconolactonase (cycloisomerase 2 family)